MPNNNNSIPYVYCINKLFFCIVQFWSTILQMSDVLLFCLCWNIFGSGAGAHFFTYLFPVRRKVVSGYCV